MPDPPQLAELIRQDHILIHPGFDSAKAAIRGLVSTLVRDQSVLPEYADDVWARERKFPTGLPTQPIGTALPHGEGDAIFRSALAIGILDRPVDFGQMGTDGSTTVAAQIILLLAINDRKQQVKVIEQVAEVLQKPKLLRELLAASTPAEAQEVLLMYISDDPSFESAEMAGM